jgi:Trk K+ transport system NAD-binding subunit
VGEDLALANRRLRDMPELGRALVAAVVRDNRVLIPTGETLLLPGDVVLLTAERHGDVVARLTAWARGEEGSPGPEPGTPDTGR